MCGGRLRSRHSCFNLSGLFSFSFLSCKCVCLGTLCGLFLCCFAISDLLGTLCGLFLCCFAISDLLGCTRFCVLLFLFRLLCSLTGDVPLTNCRRV